MKKLYIIVLNFNGGNDILECLEALQLIKVPKNLQIKILVVDNGSTDDSVKSVKNLRVKELRVLRNQKNLGFAKGNNIGIKCAHKNKADLVLLLNQDTIVSKNSLLPLLKNSADIVSPVIRFKRKGKWIYDYGGKINWNFGKTWHQESATYQFQKIFLPDYVSGCCMLIKKPVWEKIGLLEKKYFLYFEDVDYCLRAKKSGFIVATEPKSVIFHNLVETNKKTLKQNFHLVKSNLFFINDYISIWKKPLAYLYWLLISVKILLL